MSWLPVLPVRYADGEPSQPGGFPVTPTTNSDCGKPDPVFKRVRDTSGIMRDMHVSDSKCKPQSWLYRMQYLLFSGIRNLGIIRVLNKISRPG